MRGRVAWDIFLVLFSILLAAVIYSWVCATGIGVFVLIALFLTDPLMALLPFGLLVYLKNPWPAVAQQTNSDQNEEETT